MLKTDIQPNQPKEIFLKDYTKPEFDIKQVDMTVRIFDGYSLVDTVLTIEKQTPTPIDLVLNAKAMDIEEVILNERALPKEEYRHEKGTLTLFAVPAEFTLRTRVRIKPEENTELEGLYKSSVIYCTQCEAEGFRKITPYIDRPDVLSKFVTRIEADKEKCPVLLSNGNLIESGDLPDGRHYTVWDDPFLKPCYLFALVAGDLGVVEDTFTTMSGRKVDLKIWTEKGDEDKCLFGMKALKDSMKWDEEAYGREYDLDIFQIVAVSDFNFGAMENKSLNIFNTSTIFASQETSTDADFLRVEAVVGHEYFHNWSGNRVTCRDWFQLSLKEGFTVFREQSFTGDMNSHAVQRIQDVNFLKTHQFKEDAGPNAHPVRPASYIEINNFYTLTIYEKGSELIRMMHLLLGEETFKKAATLYFDRFDGQAVTCDDFVQCMEDASGYDLSHFKLWYSQAGTPKVTVTSDFDADRGIYKLRFKQEIPDTNGQKDKEPMYIPISMGLLDTDGSSLPVDSNGSHNTVLILDEAEQEFEFTGIKNRPVPSLLRDFSAPVRLYTDLTDRDYMFLMAHDSNGFNRWESGQIVALKVLQDMIAAHKNKQQMVADDTFVRQMGWLMDNQNSDKMLLAKSLTLPSTSILAQEMKIVDVDGIYHAHKALMKEIGAHHMDRFVAIFNENNKPKPYNTDPDSVGGRALKSVALHYIAAADEKRAFDMAIALYNKADNMTDRITAMSVLADAPKEVSKDVFDDFYGRFTDELLVINKWFSLQAGADKEDVVATVKDLITRDDFTWTNPNRVRAVFGAFAGNFYHFHAEDGQGYKLLADAVIKLNTINPQVAARLAVGLQEWKKFDSHRQMLMKQELERIMDEKDLSNHIYEIVSKALKA